MLAYICGANHNFKFVCETRDCFTSAGENQYHDVNNVLEKVITAAWSQIPPKLEYYRPKMAKIGLPLDKLLKQW